SGPRCGWAPARGAASPCCARRGRWPPPTAAATSCPRTSGPWRPPCWPTGSSSRRRPRCGGSRPTRSSTGSGRGRRCSARPWREVAAASRRAPEVASAAPAPQTGDTGRERRLPLPSLTPAGRAVLGGSLVLYAVGWGLGYAELLGLAAAGFVALLGAGAWTRTRPHLEIARAVAPQRVIRGERADALLRLANPTRRVLRHLTAVDRVGDRDVDVDLPRV